MTRRVLSLLAAATLLAALPTTTLAGPPQRESDTQTVLFCDGLSGDAGMVFLFAASSELFGSFGDLALWTTGNPATSPPDVVASGSSVTWDGLTMTATFDLAEFVEPTGPEDPPFGDPAGTATLSATLAPDGEPQDYSFQDRDGNRLFRVQGSFQPRSVEGTLNIDLLTGSGAEYDLDGCFAGTDTFSAFATDPNAFVASDQHVLVSCGWETPDGFVFLFAVSDRFGTFGDLQVIEGENQYFGFTEPLLTTSTFQAEFLLLGENSDDPVGSASASATLTRAERINFREGFGSARFKATGWRLTVDGGLSVTTPSGTQSYVMDDASCYAEDVRTQFVQTNPGGPKLKNDAPSGALPLEIGQTVSVRTGGTAAEPEAPCIVSDPDFGDFEVPITHTAWWTFTGTGSEVTIDTAGSDFDTVLGVYLAAGDDFEQVGCVDDVFDPETDEGSLQAAITVDTVAGQTYYLQAGGFAGSTGQLVLSIH